MSEHLAEVDLFMRDASAFVNVIDKVATEMTVEEQVESITLIDGIIKELRLLADGLRGEVAKRMESRDEKETSLQFADGSQVNVLREWKISRTQIQTDDLVKAVTRVALADGRLNKETGELLPEGEATLMAVSKAFRFEPRWSIIKELGINDDEFCQKRYQSTIRVEAGKK